MAHPQGTRRARGASLPPHWSLWRCLLQLRESAAFFQLPPWSTEVRPLRLALLSRYVGSMDGATAKLKQRRVSVYVQCNMQHRQAFCSRVPRIFPYPPRVGNLGTLASTAAAVRAHTHEPAQPRRQDSCLSSPAIPKGRSKSARVAPPPVQTKTTCMYAPSSLSSAAVARGAVGPVA